MVDEATGVVRSKWIKIQYDYMPKYCKECKLQGHYEADCRVLHPELIPVMDQEQNVDGDKKQTKLNMSPPIKKLTSGIVVGYPNGRWQEVRDNRSKKNTEDKDKEKDTEVTIKGGNKVEQIAVDSVQTTNKLALLEEGEI